MAMATLSRGAERRAVEAGSDEAKRLFGQGYKLAGPGTPRKLESSNEYIGRIGDVQQDLLNRVRGQQGFADALRSALRGADTQAKQMQDERRRLTEQEGTLAGDYRQKLIDQGVTNPFTRQSAIDQRLASLGSGIDRLGQQIDDRGARLEDVARSGLGTYQADLQAAQMEQQGLKDFLQLALQREAEERARQEAAAARAAASRGGRSSGGSRSSSRSSGGAGDKYSIYMDQLRGLEPYIVTGGQPGEGQMTREEAIGILRANNPGVPINSVQKDIYNIYRDDYRRVDGSQPGGGNDLFSKYGL